VAASSNNYDLIISAVLRRARAQNAPREWLLARQGEALDASLAGAQFITSQTDEAGGATAVQGLPVEVLLQIYEAALVLYDSQEGAAATAGAVRLSDFSSSPCVLG
jgi:hypothetical protein